MCIRDRTMALHLAFDLPKDKIIWDVGHQAYTHKILSGRKDGFDDLRQFGGMSGFPKRKESPYDAFEMCIRDRPQCDLGMRTDVMDGCPKALGMVMMIRSMAPGAVAVDEIGDREDLELSLIHI